MVHNPNLSTENSSVDVNHLFFGNQHLFKVARCRLLNSTAIAVDVVVTNTTALVAVVDKLPQVNNVFRPKARFLQ